MADKFIARQPIFDDGLKVFAYELLFRASAENRFEPNPLASQSVIVDSTMVFDLERLLGPAKAFVNVDEKALLAEAPKLLDPKRVVLELLESVNPSSEVIEACRELRRQGYELALDDFVGGDKWLPLIPLVNFLKVDYRECGEATQREIAEQYRPRGISLLAEKVETEAEVERSKRLGYTYFQGFFFCRPTMMTDHDIPAEKTVCVRLLREVAAPEMNVTTVEALLRQDPSLTYKLLRYLNSPLLGRSGEVRDIPRAVRLLGEKEFRRWVSLVAVVALATGKPIELARMAVLRGYFCEQLAEAGGRAAEGSELFLMGLLSVADALLDRPMERVLEDLPLSEKIAGALRGDESEFRGVYDLMIAYERGTWNAVSKSARRIGMEEAVLPECYLRATEKAAILV
ncbi:MAG TPA: HDOD domain-containing protein [Candidatus Dormibacteraeota bacterium]|jgi:c-di-GMP-related signal transduction protein|nr:HDOD domain-containing protein [Candidatus Dormibacteraeota bacterium]